MNFFKKLTGSLKMSAGEEIAEDTKTENEEYGAIDVGEVQGGVPEDEEGAPSEDADKEGEFKEEESAEEETPAEGNFRPMEDTGKPYTIVELARANARSKQAAKSFSHISLRKEEQEGEEKTIAPQGPEGQLTIDVYETPSDIVIKSTIAGVKPEDLDIGIEENTVNIRGARHNEEKVRGEDYFYQECYWGTFSRSVILPSEVNTDEAKATLKDGILTLRLPKIKKEREKKIKIIA